MNACPRCSSQNHPDVSICAACGAPLDAAARALLGSVVMGHYVIESVLGAGGMSVVYKARHRITDQVVALKILPPELAVHVGIKARFVEEGKALARLEHPNIVRLYNLGDDGGRFVLAMQYVEGVTFEQLIQRAGKLPWPEATRITIEVLKALDYAHGKGVVHRDIKPSNILVRPDGSVSVMDFGIAKMAAESARLTATGQTMGTVRYMSPEQVKGLVVDHRTDLYSLGGTLYEALVGDTPFDGDTHFELMSKHLAEAPASLIARGAEIPDELEEVVLYSLQKGIDERFQTAREFLDRLEAVLAKAPPELRGPALSAVASSAGSADPAASTNPTTPGVAVARPPTASPAPRPPQAPPAPGRPVGAQAGVATSVEPIVDAQAPARRRLGLVLGLGGLVAAAGAAALYLTHGRREAPAATQQAATSAKTASPWRDPFLVPGFTPVVDEKFESPEQVRVLAGRQLDAAHLARTYVAARTRFKDYLHGQNVTVAVEVHPLNVVVASASMMCDPALHDAARAPEDCSTLRFKYRPHDRTLYVLDGNELELVNLPEGAANHLCVTTEALVKDRACRKLLPPFFDELERR